MTTWKPHPSTHIMIRVRVSSADNQTRTPWGNRHNIYARRGSGASSVTLRPRWKFISGQSGEPWLPTSRQRTNPLASVVRCRPCAILLARPPHGLALLVRLGKGGGCAAGGGAGVWVCVGAICSPTTLPQLFNPVTQLCYITAIYKTTVFCHTRARNWRDLTITQKKRGGGD